MEQSVTTNDQLTHTETDTEVAAEARLAEITAMMQAKLTGQSTEVSAKPELAPFTCSMDPAERALCDSCQ